MLFRKTTLATLLVAGSTIGLAPLPASADAPLAHTSSHPSMVYISDIDIDAPSRVRPGADIGFTVRGTPGAQASLEIDGAMRTLALTETSPGVYTGDYTIGRRDRIGPASRVSVTLRRDEHVATGQLASALQSGWPSPTTAAAPLPEIRHVMVTEESNTRRGRHLLRYTMHGTPGGQATVQVEGSHPRTLVLDEVRPGEYTALFVLRPNMRLEQDRPLQGQLRIGQRVVYSTTTGAYAALNLPERFSARYGWCGPDCGVVESVSRLERGPWNDPQFEVVVRTDTGGRRIVTYESFPPVRVGDAVRFSGDGLELRGRG